jgi:hypothetical protein
MHFWAAVTKHDWRPPPVEQCWTPESYETLRQSAPSALRCFIGVVASHRCMFFQNYRTPIAHGHDYYAESVRKLDTFREPMKRVKFLKARSYEEFKGLKGYLIYADPPYRGNKLGALFRNFDSDTFWEHMRVWSKDNLVLVSEKQAPEDFMVINEYRSHFGSKKYKEYLWIYRETAEKLGM